MRRELILAAGCLAALAAPASARTERSTYHTFEKVWPTAVRHLAVDEGFKIVDRDADTGYVTFEMTEKGKTYSGALEVVKVQDDGRPAIRLVLHIAERPSWMEGAVLDRLLAKLYKEQGDPPPPPEKKPPADKPKKKK
ncbi:MAG TPA: hypothetical protein VIG06_04280 [Kofleriaceae bacterium]|jgi:hypothetical protein